MTPRLFFPPQRGEVLLHGKLWVRLLVGAPKIINDLNRGWGLYGSQQKRKLYDDAWSGVTCVHIGTRLLIGTMNTSFVFRSTIAFPYWQNTRWYVSLKETRLRFLLRKMSIIVICRYMSTNSFDLSCAAGQLLKDHHIFLVASRVRGYVRVLQKTKPRKW